MAQTFEACAWESIMQGDWWGCCCEHYGGRVWYWQGVSGRKLMMRLLKVSRAKYWGVRRKRGCTASFFLIQSGLVRICFSLLSIRLKGRVIIGCGEMCVINWGFGQNMQCSQCGSSWRSMRGWVEVSCAWIIMVSTLNVWTWTLNTKPFQAASRELAELVRMWQSLGIHSE